MKKIWYICIVKERHERLQNISGFNAVAFHNRHYRHYHDPSGLRLIFTSLRETRLQKQTKRNPNKTKNKRAAHTAYKKKAHSSAIL